MPSFIALRAVPLTMSPDPVTFHPDPRGLPGSSELTTLTNGLESWALIAATVGVLVGAVIWAFGHYSQNYQQAYNGRRGVLISGVAAILIAGAPAIVNFFAGAGTAVR